MPKVSVVIPVYNVSEFIGKCCSSLFGQTLRDMEFIFVDDCTPDDSVSVANEVLERFPDRKNQVMWIHHECNNGISKARQSGVLAASGEYVAFCDSDDWVDVCMFERMYDAGVASGADMVVCDIVNEYQDHVEVESGCGTSEKNGLLHQMLRKETSWTTFDRIVRRRVFENEILFAEKGNLMAEDMVLSLQLVYYSDRIENLREAFYHYRIADSSITHSKRSPRKSLEMFRQASENIDLVSLFFDRVGIAAEYEESLLYTKFWQKTILLPFLWNVSIRKQWLAVFPEVNRKVFFLKVPLKEKIKYILAMGGLYPLHHEMEADRAIVIGGNHHNTLGLVRSLGRRGIYPVVIVVGEKGALHIEKSKYVAEFLSLKDYDEVVTLLLSRAKAEKQVVFACSDSASSVIDMNRELLEPYYFLPGAAKKGSITKLMMKDRMAEIAGKSGLSVADAFVIRESECPDLTCLRYPCIVKPLSSTLGTKSHICILKNECDARKYFSRRGHPALLAQDWIDKAFEYQLIGCSLNGGETVVIPGRTVILHQPMETNTGFLRYEQCDGREPLEACRQFIRETCYSGLFSMEFLRGKDGKDYFMEVNFRNDGNAIAVTEAGVNLPAIWFESCLNGSAAIPGSVGEPFYVIPEFTEIELWYYGEISFKEMLEAFSVSQSYMDYADDDPSPTLGWLQFIRQFACICMKKPIKDLIRAVSRK